MSEGLVPRALPDIRRTSPVTQQTPPVQARNPTAHLPGDLQRKNWVLPELLRFPPLNERLQRRKDFQPLLLSLWWEEGEHGPMSGSV